MRHNNYVFSPSKLETYRLYRNEEFNGTITKESVIDTVLGVKKFSKKMSFGTAYHEMLEHGVEPYEAGQVYSVDVDGDDFIFQQEHVQPIIDFRNKHPNTVYECWLPFVIKLGNTNVRIRSRVDAIEGNVIHEFKTSSRGADVSHFERSCQWKLYTLG